MPIDSLNSVGYNSLAQLQGGSGTQSVRPPRDEREDGEDRGARSAEREQGAQQFFAAVGQALESVGIKPPPPPPQAAAEAGEEAREPGQGQRGQVQGQGQAREAFHAFMHELFQSLQNQSQGLGSAGTDSSSEASSSSASSSDQTGQTTPGAGQAAGYTDDVGSRLQTLMRDLASGSGRTEGLKAAFDKLAQATRPEQTQPNANAGNQNPQPELQNFLKNLAQNLQGANPVGGAVNTLV